MSAPQPHQPKAHWQVTAFFTALLMGFSSMTAYATPDWWADKGVIDADAEENNYAAANAGQLKNIVTKAAEHFNDQGIATPPATQAMLDAWETSTANNYAAVNIGQVKNTAKPFWDYLVSNGITYPDGELYTYPWTPTDTTDDNNYGLANIGQIKNVFNFTVPLVQTFVDTDGDEINDYWEQQIIDADPNDSLVTIDDVLASGDYDGDFISNEQEYLNSTDPTLADVNVIPLEWVSLINLTNSNAGTSTQTLSQTVGTNNKWNGSARSRKVMSADGAVYTKLAQANNGLMFGLTEAYVSPAFQDLHYAFFFTNTGTITIYEKGSNKGSVGTYTADDYFEIRRTGTTIEYLQNGSVIYTSATPSLNPLYTATTISRKPGTLLASSGRNLTDALDVDSDGMLDSFEAQIVDASTSDDYITVADVDPLGDFDADGLSNLVEFKSGSNPADTGILPWTPIAWESETNGVVSSAPEGELGTTLTKTSGSNSWNADAISTDVLPADGGISCRPGSTYRHSRMIGLSASNDSTSFTDLDYAIYFWNAGVIRIYENGVYKKQASVYGESETFSIEREGSTVSYKRNGVTFYTSTAPSSGNLYADCSFNTVNGEITHITGTGFVPNETYVDTDDDGVEDVWETDLGSDPDAFGITTTLSAGFIDSGVYRIYNNTSESIDYEVQLSREIFNGDVWFDVQPTTGIIPANGSIDLDLFLTIPSSAHGTLSGLINVINTQSQESIQQLPIEITVNFIDTDNDGMPDSWETENGLVVGTNDASLYADSDTLTNYQEWLNRTNPQLADTDGDDIEDGIEVAYASILDPLDGDDAFEDSDGDRIPNIWELTVIDDTGASLTVADDIYDAVTGTINASYSALNVKLHTEAISNFSTTFNSLDSDNNNNTRDYGIVIIEGGDNDYNSELYIPYDVKALVLGETLNGLPPIIKYQTSSEVVDIDSEAVLDGLIIDGENYSRSDYLVDINTREGLEDRVELKNCLIRNNSTTAYGAGIYLYDGELKLIHTTVFGNQSTSTSTNAAQSLYVGGSTTIASVEIQNSILWNPQATTYQEVYSSDASNQVTVSGSIVSDGFGGASTVEPKLVEFGLAKGFVFNGNNPIISDHTYINHDIHDEVRTLGLNTAGMDFHQDSDGDLIPDWAELHFSGGNSTTSYNGNIDPDGDGITRGEAWELGRGLENLETFAPVQSITYSQSNIDVLDTSAGARDVQATLEFDTAGSYIIQFKEFYYDYVEHDLYNDETVVFQDLANNYTLGDVLHQQTITVPSPGNYQVTWNGIDQNTGVFHTRKMVALAVVDETDQTKQQSHIHFGFEPVITVASNEISVSGGYISYVNANTTSEFAAWANERHQSGTGITVSSVIGRAVLHHPRFPALINNEPVVGYKALENWIGFEQNGTPFSIDDQWFGALAWKASSATQTASLNLSARRIPNNVIVYLNHTVDVADYSVEAYHAKGILNSTVHAQIELVKNAEISMALYSPDGNVHPLYYKENETNLRLANGLNLLGSADATAPTKYSFEFYAQDYSEYLIQESQLYPDTLPATARAKLFEEPITGFTIDSLSSIETIDPDIQFTAYWRIRFDIKNPNSEDFITKWAIIKLHRND